MTISTDILFISNVIAFFAFLGLCYLIIGGDSTATNVKRFTNYYEGTSITTIIVTIFSIIIMWFIGNEIFFTIAFILFAFPVFINLISDENKGIRALGAFSQVVTACFLAYNVIHPSTSNFVSTLESSTTITIIIYIVIDGLVFYWMLHKK